MDMPQSTGNACAWLLLASVILAPRATSAQDSKAVPPTPSSNPTLDPVPVSSSDLDRIRQALAAEPSLKIDDNQLRYYVEIVAKSPTFADYVKGYDLVNGPTRGGNPMTHQEFLNLVTPKELYSSGGITAYELLQFSFTNWLAQTLVKKAADDLKNARDAGQLNDIRSRIDRWPHFLAASLSERRLGATEHAIPWRNDD
jgi:hypothetical protein